MHRRRFLRLAPAALASAAAGMHALPCAAAPAFAGATAAPAAARLARRFPALGAVPVIGMGTWLTFDIGEDPGELARRRLVLQRFFAAGGGMIDSSPMYGRAEAVLGELLPRVPHAGRLVAATKVWTPFERLGAGQLEHSLGLWGVPRFDVVLVHNLVNWRAHLKLLRRWKDEGRVRALGVSTSHGARHEEVARILRSEPIDVLQITYNLADASAEPVMEQAAARGVAVVVNRPFDGGHLFDRVGGRPLPPWAGEVGCANWAEFFLKWIVAHPAVGCAIPATRQAAHMDENMGAGRGALPDAAARRRMQQAFDGA